MLASDQLIRPAAYSAGIEPRQPGRSQVAWVSGPGELGVMVGPGTTRVKLASAARYAASDDRVLGVAVVSMTLDGRQVPLDDPRLLQGFYATENGCRWTDGAGVLALAPSEKPRKLVVSIQAGTPMQPI